jgi:hypothetical protein
VNNKEQKNTVVLLAAVVVLKVLWEGEGKSL